ncbi:MAG TPA: acetate kinase, partial [Dehalococcoidia bacterium]|nr:acetate kinase [Dehalococcoidia bacterium]
SVDLITLQLGSGCSAAAIQGGRSVDTSMGLTPLEGLMMGTRTGDVDPSLAGYLARREGVEIEVVEEWLNKRSGLLGVSEISQDVRDLLEAEQGGNSRAALAIDMFCYRVRKYIGAYLAALGGADAVVFGGGIGENSPAIRERICVGMEWSGLVLDPRLNNAMAGTEGRISAEDSRIHAYVVPVDEAAVIARDTAECVSKELGWTNR